jgi:RNA polymerase sigma-54 factor
MQWFPELSLSQQTKLGVTPQLKQSLQILQFSCTELLSYVQEISAGNPLLEAKFQVPGAARNSMAQGSDPAAWAIAHGQTLEEHVLAQLRVMRLPRDITKIAYYLAGNLNENGYLSVTLEEASAQLGRPLQEVDNALQYVQSVEPAGLGARNLKECLLLQIRRAGVAPLFTNEAVEQHLERLAQGRFGSIADSLDITSDQVQTILDYIRTLNPRPGSSFESKPPSYVLPDAYFKVEEGLITVEWNSVVTVRHHISPEYEALMKTGDAETKKYLKQRWSEANDLIYGLEQRKKTLTRLLVTIASEQADYFRHGPSALKPLTQSQLANMLSVHESTVSRAIRNKYVQTPFGFTNLKIFITSALQTAAGQPVSSSAVKQLIQEFVGEGTMRAMMSDQKIAGRLQEQGIRISRRTVTKYREQMGILPFYIR